jgi:hypothetical protein
MSGAYATKEICSAHAYRRAKERLQLPDNFNFERFCDCLLRKIRRGDAKLVELAHEERLIYDVSEVPGYPDVVRVVVNGEKDFVISVIPPMNGADRAKQAKKESAEAKGKRTREFYRSLRIEGIDDEYQMEAN